MDLAVQQRSQVEADLPEENHPAAASNHIELELVGSPFKAGKSTCNLRLVKHCITLVR